MPPEQLVIFVRVQSWVHLMQMYVICVIMRVVLFLDLWERITIAIRVVKAPVLPPVRRSVLFVVEAVAMMRQRVNAQKHHR